MHVYTSSRVINSHITLLRYVSIAQREFTFVYFVPQVLETDKINRAALGRVASLGDLYDVRTDQFCEKYIRDGDLPETAVKSQECYSTRTQYILSDKMEEKLIALKVESELKASVIAGLVKLEGHGCYLLEEGRSAGAICSSLFYGITTKV